MLITVDSIGIPAAIRNEVAHRLASKKKLPNERLAICATHSHTTPMLSGVLATMFGAPVPPDQQQRIDKYTRELTDKLEQVAITALDDMKPSPDCSSASAKSISRSIAERRADRSIMSCPCCKSRLPTAKFAAVYVSYACHCVVLSDFKISGDWAGYAAAEIEKKYPGAVALVSIGCGADSNPECGVKDDKAEFAQQYAHEIATEVDRLFHTMLARLDGNIECQLKEIHAPASHAAVARRMGRARQNQRPRKLLRQGATRTNSTRAKSWRRKSRIPSKHGSSATRWRWCFCRAKSSSIIRCD